jgi:hypothetical protein
MSINSIGSNSALYQSLIKELQSKTTPPAANTYAEAAQTKANSNVQPTTQDIKTLLSRLTGSQPTLMDFLNNDSTSTDSTNALSGLDSTTSDLLNYDPQTAMLKAFSSADSNPDNNSDSSDPLSSLLGSLANNLSASDLSNLLDKAYSQSSQDTQSELAVGQIINKQK